MEQEAARAGAPTWESAWAWFVEHVPEQHRGWVLLGCTLLILVVFFINQITAILKFLTAWRDWFRKKEPLPAPLSADQMPTPKVSFWSEPVAAGVRPTRTPNSIPIITVAAMKGGVGKTTLTANLAAYFDGKDKRVLLVDLDYQGSLSHMVTSAANQSIKGSDVDNLIDGTGSPSTIIRGARSLSPALNRTKILTCYYQFSDVETHVMVDWICDKRQGRPVDDIRFRLERILRDPEIQSEYDLVLIDAPPRFSTGAINALCASSHVLIPTVLDNMSAEAAVYFSQDVAAMRQDLFPQLELIGVIPTMTYQNLKLTNREGEIVRYLNDNLRRFWGNREVVISQASIPRKNSIGNVAGREIAYLGVGEKNQSSEVKAIFDRVGREISERIFR